MKFKYFSRGGKKKKGGGKTVSSFYKEQLTNLMTTLHATEPHFIRFEKKKYIKDCRAKIFENLKSDALKGN